MTKKRRTLDKYAIWIICPECKTEQNVVGLSAYAVGGDCSCCSESAEWSFWCQHCGAETD